MYKYGYSGVGVRGQYAIIQAWLARWIEMMSVHEHMDVPG